MSEIEEFTKRWHGVEERMNERKRMAATVREMFEELAGLVKREIDKINESAAKSWKFTCVRGEEKNASSFIRLEREGANIRIICNTTGDLNNIVVEVNTQPQHLSIKPLWGEENDGMKLSIENRQYKPDGNVTCQEKGYTGCDDLWTVVQEFLGFPFSTTGTDKR